jgi:hypothetical protein
MASNSTMRPVDAEADDSDKPGQFRFSDGRDEVMLVEINNHMTFEGSEFDGLKTIAEKKSKMWDMVCSHLNETVRSGQSTADSKKCLGRLATIEKNARNDPKCQTYDWIEEHHQLQRKDQLFLN